MHHRLTSALAALAAAAATAALAAPAHGAFTGRAESTAAIAAAPVFAPRNTDPPVVTGVAREGEPLRATDGTWARGPVTVAYRWLRCDAAGDACAEIAGATAPTYTSAGADAGSRLRVRVTAANAGGATSAVSPATAVVAELPPVALNAPSIAGPTAVGDTLEAQPGSWSGSPSFSFRWLRCTGAGCTAVDTGPRYLLGGEDVGATLKVEITATNRGGASTATSASTATIGRHTYTQIVCAHPATGLGVDRDAALPPGFELQADIGSFGQTTSATRCAKGVQQTATRGVPLQTGGAFSTSTPGAGGALVYRVPAALQMTGAILFRAFTVSRSPGAGWDVAVQRGWDVRWIYGSPPDERCLWIEGCSARGAAHTPFAAQNALRVGAATAHVNGFNVVLVCNIPDASRTCVSHGTEAYRIFGGEVTLRDLHTPVVDTASGSLLTDATLAGTEQLTVAARDEGAGLYRVRVRLGDTQVAEASLAPTTERCRDVAPDNADPYEFNHPEPCPRSATTTAAFDTTGWPRGEHTMRVLVEDAGRNTVTVQRRTVTVGS
jgi:hypothetical protein